MHHFPPRNLASVSRFGLLIASAFASFELAISAGAQDYTINAAVDPSSYQHGFNRGANADDYFTLTGVPSTLNLSEGSLLTFTISAPAGFEFVVNTPYSQNLIQPNISYRANNFTIGSLNLQSYMFNGPSGAAATRGDFNPDNPVGPASNGFSIAPIYYESSGFSFTSVTYKEWYSGTTPSAWSLVGPPEAPAISFFSDGPSGNVLDPGPVVSLQSLTVPEPSQLALAAGFGFAAVGFSLYRRCAKT